MMIEKGLGALAMHWGLGPSHQLQLYELFTGQVCAAQGPVKAEVHLCSMCQSDIPWGNVCPKRVPSSNSHKGTLCPSSGLVRQPF